MNIAGNAPVALEMTPQVKGEAVAPVRRVKEAQPEAKSEPEQKESADQDKRAKELTAVYDAVDMVNQKLMVKSTNLVFEFDGEKDPPIVKVVDKANGEIIREIPSKELREIAKALNSIADNVNSSAGVLLNEQL
ncbi:flagellar protein FlaG [Rheinheimera sp.]|uniref:flagellar protein FlaG n=1 Tax=Rheinheimera sp. TaxID=1869214 RepID=UPI00307E6C39